MSWRGEGTTKIELETEGNMGEESSWFQELPQYFKRRNVKFPFWIFISYIPSPKTVVKTAIHSLGFMHFGQAGIRIVLYGMIWSCEGTGVKIQDGPKTSLHIQIQSQSLLRESVTATTTTTTTITIYHHHHQEPPDMLENTPDIPLYISWGSNKLHLNLTGQSSASNWRSWTQPEAAEIWVYTLR